MGCTRLTAGCDNCPSYWEFKAEGRDYSARVDEKALMDPLKNEIPSSYCVAFGSDLFHWRVPTEFIIKAFNIMNRANYHTFEITTKRAQRLADFADKVLWSPNIAIGVAVESHEYRNRIDALRKVPTPNRYVSMCPIVGPMKELDLSGIALVGVVEEDWGTKRKAEADWIRDVEKQADEQGVVFSSDYYLYKEAEVV